MYDTRMRAVIEARECKIPEDLRLNESMNLGKRKVIDVPSQCGILSDLELTITEKYDATSLRNALASSHLSAVDVVTAFAKRAAIAHQLTNCLTDWFLPDALKRAKWLDNELARTGKPVGPLHGVPISVKDQVCIRGYNASAGYLSTNNESDQDSVLIATLRDLGAVFYVKTNMPQAIMHLECESFYGRTVNPYNREFSSGGSSGGEGALLALRGSILGIGTDIGGSIRNPAATNGVFGYRPTTNVLPYLGIKVAMPGNQNITSVVGPMAHTLRDCALFVEAVLSSPVYHQDLNMVPPPWPQTVRPIGPQSPLRLGVLSDDGVVRPHTALERGMTWVCDKLRNVPGIELIPYTPYGGSEGLELISSLYFTDGGKTVRAHCQESGEPVHPLTEWVLQPAQELTSQELWAKMAHRVTFRHTLAKHWDSMNLDVVLSPVYVAPGAPHNTSLYWNYTALWNLVDFPCIAFPTGLYAGTEGREKNRIPRNKYEKLCIKNSSVTADCQGAPIGFQLIGKPYQDAHLFGRLAQLEEYLHA